MKDRSRLTRLLDGQRSELEEPERPAWAIDLLRQAPPHHPRPGERQRVLMVLRHPESATRHVWTIRLGTAATVLVAATTIAWAGLGHLPRWLTAPSPVHSGNPGGASRVAHVTSRPMPRTTASRAEAVPPTPSPPRVARRLRSTDRPDDDSRLVVEAMHALRVEGDPALARALCRTYLDRHPNGAVAQEALALAIEAAIAHGDPDAPGLGVRYLRQHPNGPFRGLARRASRAAFAPEP